MAQKVSDERLAEFARKQNEWFRKVKEGSLGPEEVIQAVEQIIGLSSSKQDRCEKKEWEFIEDIKEAHFHPP